MLRLLLIRHGATAAVRSGAFASDEPLEPAARARAAQLAGGLPASRRAVTGPEPACRETAAALGLDAEAEAALAACDLGAWRGRSLAAVEAGDPTGLVAWMTDPDATPHGGESLTAFAGRVAEWMAAVAGLDGYLVATVDGGVIRAAAGHALGAPSSAFWRIDVAPLHVSELHARAGRWTVRHLNAPLARHDGLRYAGG